MSGAQRVSRVRADRQGARGRDAAPAAAAHASSPALAAPAWAAVPAAAPFALGGVQRKVAINEPGDAFEREAESVGQRVASGQIVAPESFSALAPGALGSPSQRAAAPTEKKKEEKPAVQKAAAPEKKKDEKSAPNAVHKADKPDEKKKEPSKPSAVQKADKPDEKKKEPPKPAPVQKAVAPDEKKKESPKAPPVQKGAKPEEKKPAQVQKAAAPKKKDDKPAVVQKAGAPAEKKKEEKPVAVQKAPQTEKKKDEKPPAVQKAGAPEKKKEDKPAPAVQKAAADDKKKEPPKPAPVQKAVKERDKKDGETLEDRLKDAPVQKAAAPEKKKEESPKPAVQKVSGSSGSVTPSMESAAAQAIQRKGAGEPMNSGTRGALESRMGADLSGVRVHQDRAARQAASDINARAFTHGSDIWLGHGESQNNVGLMAHEATHVVQQNAGVGRMLVQRVEAASPAASGAGDWDFEAPASNPVGKIKATGNDKRMSIPVLTVPKFKEKFTKGATGKVTLPKKEPGQKRTDTQRAEWDKNAKKDDKIGSKIDEKCQAENVSTMTLPGDAGPSYFFRVGNSKFYVIGTKEDIKETRLVRPYWNEKGVPKGFQVDHKKELQLSESETEANDISNLWLLEETYNMRSGSNINVEKETRILELIDAATKKKEKKPKKGPPPTPAPAPATPDLGKSKPIWDDPPKMAQVRQEYTITFESVAKGLEPTGDPEFYELEHIKTEGKQIAPLHAMSEAEVTALGLRGTAENLSIFSSPTGAAHRVIKNWPAGKDAVDVDDIGYGKKAFKVTRVEYNSTTKEGFVHGEAYKNVAKINVPPLKIPIRKMAGVAYGGYLSRNDVLAQMKEKPPDVPGASPVEMFDVEIVDKGFSGRGQLLPTVPLIKDLGIDLVLDGDDIYLSRVFTAGDLKFPGPVQVTGAVLEAFAGTQGLGVKGIVLFSIERVGRGKLTASASTSGGFLIGGDFDFDSEVFEPATIHVQYKYAEGKGTLSGVGHLGIPEGKVRGIKSAMLTVSFVDESITATGVVKPNIPAVEQGSMEFRRDPETGIVISGRLDMKKDLPGIESGWVEAALAKRPGEDRWKVKAHGEAVPKIPGVSTKLVVDYDDGLFDVLGTAGYEKGMLKGSISIGATNRPVNPDGVPAPGPPPDKADKVVIYGGGSVTLKLSPWLQATAAIRLLPNGEIEVTGKIGLPAALELFKGKELQQNIFKIGIDIPIVGIAVAGQRIGIFANISGGLDIVAGIGPGALQQLELGVTYNPSHEDQTHVFGGAKLHIPAHAGLRLFVRGSLGVGIPLVSASAGIELGGELGIAGALDAAVQVDWTPAKGLDIQAMAEVYAEPKFKFDITGFVLVELDAWVKTWELYSKKWQLASFEYGSGLRLGLKLPIHYQEGKPFDISLSDVQFEKPNIEPKSLLEGLVKKIA